MLRILYSALTVMLLLGAASHCDLEQLFSVPCAEAHLPTSESSTPEESHSPCEAPAIISHKVAADQNVLATGLLLAVSSFCLNIQPAQLLKSISVSSFERSPLLPGSLTSFLIDAPNAPPHPVNS